LKALTTARVASRRKRDMQAADLRLRHAVVRRFPQPSAARPRPARGDALAPLPPRRLPDGLGRVPHERRVRRPAHSRRQPRRDLPRAQRPARRGASSATRAVISGPPGSAAGRGAPGRIASSRIPGSGSRSVASRWPRSASVASSPARVCRTSPASSARLRTRAPIANVSPSATARPSRSWQGEASP
jgi:hypothetical protein